MFAFGSANDLLGLETTWVGYGVTGTGLTGKTAFPDARLGMNNIVDAFGEDIDVWTNTFVSDFDSPDGQNDFFGFGAIPLAGEGNVATGDSGGGVFARVDATEYLVGITAFAGFDDEANDGDYGDISGATVIQNFENWIETTSGVSFVPELSHSGIISGFLVIGLATLRRRRAAHSG